MEEFYSQLLIPLKEFTDGGISVENVRKALSRINKYFYTSYPDIGELYVDDLDFTTEYFSEFHKLWSVSAGEIIAPNINDVNCAGAAEVLHAIRSQYGDRPFEIEINLHGLDARALAQVRFLTANQDFRGSRDPEKYFEKYRQNPMAFDLLSISEKPGEFLNEIGISTLSQNDKREKFAKKAADFLLDKGISAEELCAFYDNDAGAIKGALVASAGMGYGNKKADMFIRDMYVWSVWSEVRNLAALDVPSDINTMKVALRSRILETELTPLLSSFLDIFCYQYSLIDDWTGRAWRRVWEIWQSEHGRTAPYGPVFMDHLLYGIVGRDFCKENLYEYVGEGCEHVFYWDSGGVKKCKECSNLHRDSTVTYRQEGGRTIAQCAKYPSHSREVENRRGKRCAMCESTPLNEARVVSRYLPCTHERGAAAIGRSKYVESADSPLHGIEECPFAVVCRPKSGDFRKLSPPKSISILGKTGWDSARTSGAEGGGGLMS